MKFYLSSYRMGNKENIEKLKEMTSNTNKSVAYISNALDFGTDRKRRQKTDSRNMTDLVNVGLNPEHIDLRDYFGKKDELFTILSNFDVLRLSGGNTFVLRQAMKLSGFDDIVKELYTLKKDIVYCGYSAGVCILGPTLKGFSIVDDPLQKPYGKEYETLWDGLGILPYSIAPHYRSDHPESEDIDKEIALMIEKKMPFIALKDGEVIIIE